MSTVPAGPDAEDSRAIWWALIRVLGMLAVGVLAFWLTSSAGWLLALTVGWLAAAATYVLWVWLIVGRMDGVATSSHAVREDPSRALTNVLLVAAAVASVVAVVGLLVVASVASGSDRVMLTAVAFASIVSSWVLVYTLYTLEYARLFYSGRGGADFPGTPTPAYADFAYLAFTVGMTYQVSDTAVSGTPMRSAVLRHALLSFVLDAVILATVVNVIVGLAG